MTRLRQGDSCESVAMYIEPPKRQRFAQTCFENFDRLARLHTSAASPFLRLPERIGTAWRGARAMQRWAVGSAMADIFISYSSADRVRIGELASALEKEGLSVWWDRALVTGASYETEIDSALANAKAVVVAWTLASIASDWVRSEADEARRAGKLVPVLLEQCRVPRPFDRLHTADLTKWRGDRGNQGFPELVEAVKSLLEGRPARPIPWKRRITFAAVVSAIVTGIIVASAVTGVIDTALRWTSSGAFANQSAERLSAGEIATAATQEGFREALAELARSLDLRTQRALTTLERGSREEALVALKSLAEDQGQAIEGQMQRAANLWRQIGLLRFSEDAGAARTALENARRFAPDDPTILTALGVLYQREGRIADADEAYRRVLSLGALSRRDEGRVRQVLGQAALERSETEAAEREFLIAMQLAQEGGDEELEADLSIDLGLVELERGNYRAAHAHFNYGRDFARSFDYLASVSYADFNAIEL